MPFSTTISADEDLLDNIHPPRWKNPQPAGCYNLVVIGAGTAGLVCAAGAAGLGARVALIERHLMGGDCLNYGCVPSKALIRASRAAHEIRAAGVFGVSADIGSIEFGKVMDRLREVRGILSSHDSARRFRDELGVDVFFGSASFTGSDSIDVGGAQLTFHRAAVCTGARAVIPPIPGLRESGCLTNETVFSLQQLPPRLAVLGSGPIGCELAQAFARLGSSVTLLEQGERILHREDQDVAGLLTATFVREGIDVRRNVSVVRVGLREGKKVLELEENGRRTELEVDEIMVGVGRAPTLQGLGLEKGGIAYDASGIRVTDHLQTSNRRVYAAGDVCSPYKFTHTADAHARIVIANALFMGQRKVSSLTVPWCTFTDPEIAHVGLYEQEAQDRGIAVQTLTVPLAEVDRSVLDGETEGFARVHLKKGSDTILGATVVSRNAGEIISELTLCMTSGRGLSAIGRTIHPYPTKGEMLRKLADAWNRTRLTPGRRRFLEAWLRWQRF